MSWQAYVDTQLVASGYIQEAIIVGRNDCNPWGGTPDFLPRRYRCEITKEDMTKGDVLLNEAENVVSFVKTGEVPQGGLRFNGQRYRILKMVRDGVGGRNIASDPVESA